MNAWRPNLFTTIHTCNSSDEEPSAAIFHISVSSIITSLLKIDAFGPTHVTKRIKIVLANSSNQDELVELWA